MIICDTPAIPCWAERLSAAAIAARAESGVIPHGDPADRLIGATALVQGAPPITVDQQLPCSTRVAVRLVAGKGRSGRMKRRKPPM